MNRLGIVLDDRYFNHQIEGPTPENPGRLRSLYPAVKDTFGSRLQVVNPIEVPDKYIQQVHSNFYINQIREHALNSNPFSYDKDTYLMDESLATARLGCGGCLELADNIMADEFKRGFALIRPPGHHAEPGRGMGFCILNHAAITAKYLQQTYKINRILIVDFDVHHGNGTQEAFYETDNVMFFSIHQANLFPFSGTIDEVGAEKGLGYNINMPVFSYFGDEEYTYLLGKTLHAIAEQFMPQFIIVSAGYDGHADDSISSTTLSTKWFNTAATLFKQVARDVCDDRLLFILEGGYNPVSLQDSVMETIDSLITPDVGRVGILHSERAVSILREHPLNDYWVL